MKRRLLLLALMAVMPATVRAQQSATEDSVLMRRERAQWDALKAGDTTAFGKLMGGGLVDVDVSGSKRTTPASTARYVLGCQTASYAITDAHVAHYTSAAVVSYKAVVEQTCWGQKAPSPLFIMTVYEKREGAWVPIAHSETPAVKW